MIKRTMMCLVALTSLGIAIGCSSEEDSPAAASSGAKPAATASAKTVTPAMIDRGRAIYKVNCIACHGETGKGDGPASGAMKPPPRDHTDPAYMNTLTDKNLADVIRMGGAIKGKPLMPSHPQLNGTDLDAIVAHVRSLSAPR